MAIVDMTAQTPPEQRHHLLHCFPDVESRLYCSPFCTNIESATTLSDKL